MKTLKKIGVLCLTATLAVTVLAGCKQSSDKESGTGLHSNESTNQSSGEVDINPVGELPIVNEKVSFTTFAVQDPGRISDLSTNEFTKYFEDLTNVHFEFVTSTQQDAKDKLNLLLASDDYPELIFNSNFTATQDLLYGQQGMLLPLNDLIDKYGVNFKKQADTYEPSDMFLKRMTMPDGNIYGMISISYSFHGRYPGKMWVYQPWLDKLNIEMPTTTEEFAAMLKAFRDNDPNGNGKADEIPLAGCMNGWDNDPLTYIMNAFIYDNPAQNHMYIDNGEIKASYVTDEWKNGLVYMNSLAKEGLLASETYTQNSDQLKNIGVGSADGTHILGTSPAGYEGSISNLTDGVDGEWNKWAAIPPLKGPDGVQLAAYTIPMNTVDQFNITDKCKNPEVAFRAIDLLYNDEMAQTMYCGQKGKYWDYTEEGEGTGLDGKTPAVYKYLPANSSNDMNVSWGWLTAFGISSSWFDTQMVSDPDTNLESQLYTNSKKYEPYAPKYENVVPNLTFTEANAKKLSDYQTTIETYLKEMTARFVTGDVDINGNWDVYIQKLNDMGLPEYLKIYQEAYDRQK